MPAAGVALLPAVVFLSVYLAAESLGLVPPHSHSWQPMAVLIGFIALAAVAFVLQSILERRRTEERRRGELELRESREAALAASLAKSRFLAAVSHEMRTPLNAIIGMLQLALGEEPAGRRDRYLRAAKAAGDQLLELINELLDVSKIESGALQLTSRPFSLGVLLEGCVETVGLRAKQKGLELAWEMADGMPDGVRGDAARVRQVLLNLLDNAVKFTDRGRVVVSVLPAEGGPSGRLHFRVTDTGIGIAPGDRERIFEPFTQADGSDTRRHGGTGLGLTICKQLVERMGGRLWFQSELGRGSTFHVELDLSPDPAGDAVELGEAAELGGLRVLVVHRDAGTQERLCAMLSDLNLEGTPTNQPSRVPQLLREAQAAGRPFGLLLLDRHIRGAAALLARHPGDDPLVSQLPQVLISSDTSGASAGRIGTAPMLLGSPTPRELLGAVRDALEAEARKPPSAEAGPGTVPGSRPLRVLVAEDNPVNAFMAVRMLELLGHTSQVVEDGTRAVAAVESNGFDAVLMDVQMPGMDGLEATRRIRARERNEAGRRVRVVALTANAMKGDAERCLAAGADAYLAKPFELEALRAVLAGRGPAAPNPGHAGTLDLPRLEALLGGDSEGVAQVLDSFQAQLPGYLARVREGVVAGDARAVEEAAHKLKGALLWITADSAAEAASLLERLGTSGELTEAAEALTDLERKLTTVRDAISRSRATSAEDRA